MKKIKSYYVDVTTRLIVSVPEGTDIFDVVNEMDYNFQTFEQDCQVLDEHITSIDVIKSEDVRSK